MKKVNHFIIIGFVMVLVLCSGMAWSQATGRMETDRPDQTESPFIVRKNWLQSEFGFNFNRQSKGNEWLIPTSLVKFGLLNWLELRYQSSFSKSENEFGYNPEALGIKMSICEEKGIIPKLSVISHFHLGALKPDPSELNPNAHSVMDMIFTAQNSLSQTIAIGYNFGVEAHANGKFEWIYRIAPGINIGKNGYVYGEVFGRLPLKTDEDIWMDGGYAHYLSEHVKVDFSLGRSIGKSRDYYVAMGLSFRIKTR